MECSAATRQNIRDVFYSTQRIIAFPVAPLFNRSTQSLTDPFYRILCRVFCFFDRDQDGVWSLTELNRFEVVHSRRIHPRSTASPPRSPSTKSMLSTNTSATRIPLVSARSLRARRESRGAASWS